MNDHWSGCDTVVPHYAARSRRKARVDWSPSDRKMLADLWTQKKPKLTAEQIGEIIGGRTAVQVYAKVAQMGLPGRNKGQRSMRDKSEAFDFVAERSGRKHGGTQRRFQGANSTGPRIVITDHHPAIRKGTTFFPSTVIPAAGEVRMLKSGDNSRKIGAVLEKGRWKGQHIYTLTLEERDTCPPSCLEYKTCYGNNMPFARRIHDDGTLMKRLWAELAVLSIDNPTGFIVRLHVLGDFFSVEYVDFWRQALEDFPKLNIFGFTARQAPDPIGIALLELTAAQYERFRMRFSAGGHKTDCSEVVDAAEDVNFVRCPAETDPKRCCASCGLCMQSNVSISFVRH
jgi:hypothetical protein